MSLESIAPEFFAPPPTLIDGIPAAVTVDLAVGNDLSDMGTGIGFDKPWTQESLNAAAARAASLLDPSRVR